MKTLDEVLDYQSQAIDGHNINHLTCFMTVDQIKSKGFVFNSKEEEDAHTPEPFTEESVKCKLKADLAFAFEKALNKRVLYAGMMFIVVSMWVWILGDTENIGSASQSNYAHYGLPYLKAVALYYGFDNPIGDNTGREFEYSAEAG